MNDTHLLFMVAYLPKWIMVWFLPFPETYWDKMLQIHTFKTIKNAAPSNEIYQIPYHNKKKSQPITKIVCRLLTICCTTRWRFQCGFAVQGKWSVSVGRLRRNVAKERRSWIVLMWLLIQFPNFQSSINLLTHTIKKTRKKKKRLKSKTFKVVTLVTTDRGSDH